MENKKYLNLLKKDYPTHGAIMSEIINLEAILSMPKGTEHFVSDIHGEYEAFCHLLNTCSGVIREKVNLLYKNVLPDYECAFIASLISYPTETIELMTEDNKINDEWYEDIIEKLVHILLRVCSKYTRSKVNKAVNPEFAYIINELINAKREGFEYEKFCKGVYHNIIELKRANAFIETLATSIKKLAVANLHIVGDIFDRGEHPDYILDLLLDRDNVDIQWGNHDIQWIGAGLGNIACIANILYIAFKAGDVEAIEDGYGISLRRLEDFARKTYEVDPRFAPRKGELSDKEFKNFTRMRKAIFFIMLKAEAEIIKRNPNYGMDDRIILERLDRNRGVFIADDGEDFADNDFREPYSVPDFTAIEEQIVEHLKRAFTGSVKLQKHIAFLMKYGNIYKKVNGNLLYHGCVPMNDDGTYAEVKIGEKIYSGKSYFDECERMVRRAYANHLAGNKDNAPLDFLWYLWCGKLSPLFGREKIATFERVYLPKEYGIEKKNAYYKYVLKKEVCEKILADFGLVGEQTHIINGHVPVKTKDGETPIKADGKLLVIDGGFCRAYQPTTGIAGYTLIFNSYGLRLSAHEPFGTKEEAIENYKDIHSNVRIFESAKRRLTVADTDKGIELINKINDLKELSESGLV